MHVYTCRCKHIPVDAACVYTCICFWLTYYLAYVSTYICFSKGVPLMLPYRTYQSFLSGFHLPPASFMSMRRSVSYPSILTATSVSAANFSGGGSQSARSITNSTVLSRCFETASYLNRTHNKFSPYFSVSRLVPRWPGFRMSRVFIASPIRKIVANYTQYLIKGELKTSRNPDDPASSSSLPPIPIILRR